jgi:hypothetical protein
MALHRMNTLSLHDSHSKGMSINLWSLCWVICLALAGPALAAEGKFDGTYIGKRMLAKGVDQTCPTEDNVSVTIIHGVALTFSNSRLRGFIIGFEPHPDGSFREAANRYRRRHRAH